VNAVCETDYLAINSMKFCGDFPTMSQTANATAPINLHVKSDDDNSNLEEGFAATYVMMPC